MAYRMESRKMICRLRANMHEIGAKAILKGMKVR